MEHFNLINAKKADFNKIGLHSGTDTDKILRRVENRQITPEEGFRLLRKLRTEGTDVHTDVQAVRYYFDIWEKFFPGNELQGLKPVPEGDVLIFDSDESLSNALSERLETEVIRVSPGERRIEDYRILLNKLRQEGHNLRYIIVLWPDAAKSDEISERIRKCFYPLFLLGKALIEQKPTERIHILCAFPERSDEILPEYAAIGAYLKTLRQEHPKLVGRTIALSDFSSLSDILVTEMQIADRTEIRYKNSRRWVKQVKEAEIPARSPSLLRKNGVYLLTGGTGKLGLIFAEYLARKWKAKLILSGRSDPPHDAVSRLTELGAEVFFVRADMSLQADVRNLIAQAKSRFKTINGIIHAAGEIRDAYIFKKNLEDISRVLGPKIFGTEYLDETLKDEPLDFFVMFSSLSSVLGNAGQCDYAYSNSFMDYFAEIREKRRSRGERSGKTLSLNWPLWKDGGMRLDNDTAAWLKNNAGLEALSTENGISAFETLLNTDYTRVIVTCGNQEKIKNVMDNSFRIKPEQKTASLNSGTLEPSELQKTALLDFCTPDSSSEELKDKTERFLKQLLSEKLKIPASRFSANAPFEKYGIDSLIIVALTRELEKQFGELSGTLFFEYQTLGELTDYFISHHRETLLRQFGNSAKEVRSKVTEVRDSRHAAGMPLHPAPRTPNPEPLIAIVGISGRYPMARNLGEFWENLKAGKDCITEIPKERWDYRLFYDPDKKEGRIYSKWGGFIEDSDKFDARFFNMTPREAELTDPQERLFLETVWHTLEDGGYRKSDLWGHRVGVFAGIMWGEYQLFGPEALFMGYPRLPGSSYASVANRISYFFNFTGPSMALDSMCSSSLTAIHLACQSIRLGESEMAIAGGVNVSIHPQKYFQLSQGRFASSEGRCRSFGRGGDGYVPAEGVGAVLLKPLSAAVAAGDHIYAVIRGSAINHGGKTNGYTVPNPNAQAAVISDALRKTDTDPATISYLEAHGTGTSLGDPIEITGLVKAFGNHRQKKQYCAIGSVKSNIGHAESAAGIAALSKVLLQLKHKQLVPSIHSEPPNSNIRFNDSPFYIQKELTEWKQPEIEINGEKKILPRRAGISSFGAGGSNAHLIIEEYGNGVRGSGYEVRGDLGPRTSHPGPHLIVLSAGNENQLIAYAAEMVKFLVTGDSMLLPEPVLQKESLIRDVVKFVSETTGVSETEIDPDESFREYGLDAVDLGNLAERLSEISQLEISAAIMSDHPSAQALAHFLTETDAGWVKSAFNYATRESDGADFTHPTNLADVVFTLQVAREPMAERIAIVVSDIDELRDKLSRFIRREEEIENLFRGNAGDRGNLLVKGRAGQAFVSILIQDGELDRLGQLWVSGADIDWKLLYPDETPRRIPIPLYPFAKERHWITDSLAALLKDQQAKGRFRTGPSLLSFDSRAVPRLESREERGNPSESMTDYLIRLLSEITKIDAEQVNPAEDFEVLGLDSVMIAQLNTELERRFGKLPSTLFFKYKNLKSLAAYLLENHKEEGQRSEVRGSGDEPREMFKPMSYRRETNEQVHTHVCEDIAVIGLSGVYPLAENLEIFWENLKAGRDCITEIPKDRWDYRAYPGMYCKWGGFISDADKFDPSFFSISPNTARFMDPQERLFLQTAWACIEDAGYTRDRLADLQSGDRRGRVGVFAGVTFNDYQLYSAAEWSKGNIIPLNSQIFSVANRVSYHLNLGGPSLSVDTACSSSLYAIHLACESIRRKECSMALAGGVNLSTHPAKYVTLCLSRFAASDGRCRAFGEGGDGYVPGEGVGAVFLKPLSQAVADHDHIYAVIKGTAVNHDGKTQGYTVPNPVAQSEVIRTAFVRSGINPRTVSYVEAHGTGTSLGDPIEITGLSDVYKEYSGDKQYCAIGSVKSNIGHPEAAAGIAQITKVLLQMKHQTLVPSLLHSERMNPNIDFGNCPFYVQQRAEPWKQPVIGNRVCPRRAGLSSFGAGGVNVHIVLEEYETRNGQKPDNQTKAMIIPLSAKSEDNLRAYTARLKNFVEMHSPASLRIEDIAYTLQTGRESMPFRAAFAVKSPDELLEKLEGYLGKGKSVEGVFQGKADKKFRSEAEKDISRLKEQFQKGITAPIAELWTRGAEIDWENICMNGNKPRRISLPTYPFSKERYWVFGSEEPAVLPEKSRGSEISSENNLSVAAPKKEETLLTSQFSVPTSGTASGFLAELADAPEDEQQEMLAEYFQNKIGKLLGFAPPNLPAKDQGFFEIGMESIQAMQLHSDIGDAFAVTLPDTALFDYPNIRELSAYLLKQIRFDDLQLPDTKVDKNWKVELSDEELEYLIWDTLPADIEAMSIDAVERMLEAEMN